MYTSTQLTPRTVNPSPTSEAQHAINFEEYLRVETNVDDYNFFRDRWTPGTCDWVLNRDGFNRWLEDRAQNSRVLWIYGNAATGKSTLSSFVINHLIQLDLPCHYFFIRYSSQKKRNLSMILRSIACQLAHSIPEYAEKLRQLADANTDLQTSDYRNVWQWLYKQTLFQLSIDRPLYLILDGVDESEAPGSIIRLLSDLQSVAIPLRILVVSRRTHEISSAFQRLGREILVETVHIDGNREDFRYYINLEMDMAAEDDFKSHITEQLLGRSGGNFLWVYLAVQKINACYTRDAVIDALKNLPPGMEALYDRMAEAVQSLADTRNGKLGRRILEWATCAQRPLSVKELSDALDNIDILEIQRAIDDLCGGFVVVDKEGKVALIHETAREYLTKGGHRDRPAFINHRTSHDTLFKSCLQRLTNVRLRAQILRNQPPALLDYAMNSWFIHYTSGSFAEPASLEALVSFLKSPHILTWMNIAARKKQLRAMVVASRYLTDVVVKLRKLQFDDCLENDQTIALIEGWATDLVKIVGKFGTNMTQTPDAIHKLIPPFCPQDSVTYQQFGRKEAKALLVTGLTSTSWDDCLARFSFDTGIAASAVLPAGSRIAILTTRGKSSRILIHHASTFEEQRVLEHPERVFKIQVNKLGNLLVSYGYLTTILWDTKTGARLKAVKNPPKKPRPHTMRFIDNDKAILVGGEDRVFRYFSFEDDVPRWQIRVQIEEEIPEDAVVMFPTCSSLSPDGNMVLFGYRQHPVTLWDLETEMLLGSCGINLSEADMTTADATYGEVYSVEWHPFNGDVFGLTQTGLLFRWDTHDDEANDKVETGGDFLTVSREGSLLGTGDGVGTIKIFASPDLSLLYQLSSQDSVLNLSFSADSRRLYDIRGQYANVWEPNTLMRLADDSEYPDHGSDNVSEIESLTRFSLQTEHQSARVDTVTTLAGQSVGSLYCYGTEDGIAVLCHVEHGTLFELERLKSFMSIENVAWSDDDNFVAISDLGGTILLKRVQKASEQQDAWVATAEFSVQIPPSKGHIRQIIFHPTGNLLFAFTALALFSISLETHAVTESILPPTTPKLKWLCHPTTPDYLFGFGTSHMLVYTTERLQRMKQYSYHPPRSGGVDAHSAETPRGTTFRSDTHTLGRIIASPDSPHILLVVSHSTPSGRYENDYLLFTVTDINADASLSDALSYTMLPEELSSRIREPLAFLSRGRLLVLDVDRWIGSCRMKPSAKRTPSGKTAEASTGAFEQYYFLPGDWATGNEAELCSVMPDGTLLCPRNGEVAAVQSNKMRK
jgi:WD40 repeat protein